MSRAEELLNGLGTEEYIIIGADRHITVPNSLKRIAVQGDNNIETVVFKGPRYWDNHDLSSMTFRVNYERSDGKRDSYAVDDINVDVDTGNYILFTWVISRKLTAVKGPLSFSICAIGEDDIHWNSEICKDMYISEGLEVNEYIADKYPDVIEEIKSDIEDLESDIENSSVYFTDSSSSNIYDIDITKPSKNIKTFSFEGAASQASGATLSSPKAIRYPNRATVMFVGRTPIAINSLTGLDLKINQPILAVGDYKDIGWYDFNSKILYRKHIIKVITLTGDEKAGVWQKASSPIGRYFVNLHSIDGVLTADDLTRLNDSIQITRQYCISSITNQYWSDTFTESGQCNITQGTSNGKGYLRFQFFAPEFETLDDVREAVRQNPVTLLIPMIYDVKEYSIPFPSFESLLDKYATIPFKLYLTDGSYNIPSQVTYKADVGLAIQNLKDAVKSLGGDV